MTVHPCGCATARDVASGITRRTRQCDGHRAGRRDPATLGLDYYAALGLIEPDGRARATAHVEELAEALGPIPRAMGQGGAALEVGCGCSPYVGAIRAAGWHYVGLEPSHAARDWMARHYAAPVLGTFLEALEAPEPFGLILAAHVVEHASDAPAMLRALAGALRRGGTLLVIVPDDSDPLNPDHDWFFTLETLGRALSGAGLAVERLAACRRVPHELFLYGRAVRR